MPAHRIRFEWAEDGSLDALDYGVIVPDSLIREIVGGNIGAYKLGLLLGITPSRASGIIRFVRDPKPAIRSGGPVARVTGVHPGDLRPDADAVLERAREDFARAARLAAQRDAQRIELPGPVAALVFVADTHIGGRGVDIDRAFSDAALIRETPGMFGFYVGDLVDNFVIGKLVAARFDARMSVPDEWALGERYLREFGSSLVAVVGGNHDAWTARLAGQDALLNIVPAAALYDADEIRAEITTGGGPGVSLIARHQWRGFSMYNPFHPQGRGARFEAPGFDLYVGAHTHTLGGYSELPHAGRVVGLIQCGTYKIHDPYQRVGGFPRTTHTAPVAVIFHADGTWFGTSNIRAAAAYVQSAHRAAA